MTTSQCSSRKARTDAEAFSRQPYSESMLQILLNSLAECSDGVKASIRSVVCRCQQMGSLDHQINMIE